VDRLAARLRLQAASCGRRALAKCDRSRRDPPTSPTTEELAMLDAILVLGTVLFFIGCLAYAKRCERM
jgi:hypothetical protein